MKQFLSHCMLLLISAALLLLSGCAGHNNGATSPDRGHEPAVTNQPRLEPKPDRLALARRLIDQGHYEVALVQLKQAGRETDSTSEINHLIGVCLRESGDLAAAGGAFQKAIEQDPLYAPAYNGLGLTLVRQKAVGRALPCFERSLALDPAKTDVCNNLGYALMKSGYPTEAERVLRRCLAIDPGFSVARNNLAVCLGLQGRDEQALQLLLQSQPPADALRNLSAIARKRGDTMQADTLLERARETEGRVSSRDGR